jgi:hypothetical protein
MRLLNTSTLQLETFSSSKYAPPYAILSHTRGKDQDEVSFEDLKPTVPPDQTQKKVGYEKIKMTCQLALDEHDLKYAWIDTCCIDKSSSAELSESINSMFRWYRQAVVCFAFLSDWEPEDTTFAHCKWFTRGWTLQELVASKTIVFYDKTWTARGDKSTRGAEIARVSSIGEDVLTGQTQMSDVPVAVRMSWAANRITTREEDIAYSLMGIFDVNMSMLYGEGDKAFLRLQEEIIRINADMSIFAWKASGKALHDCMGLLAPSPREFKHASRMYPVNALLFLTNIIRFSISNRGVELKAPLGEDESTGYSILPLLHSDLQPDVSVTNKVQNRRTSYGVYLRLIGSTYVRSRPDCFANFVGGIDGTGYPALKRMSTSDSDAISRRQIHIRTPTDLKHPDFGLATIDPSHAWIPALCSFQAVLITETIQSLVFLTFQPDWAQEFSSFYLLCQFENLCSVGFSLAGFWRCDLVLGGRLWRIEDARDYFLTYDGLSCRVEEPSPAAKALDLPHSGGDSRIKRVELSLQMERSEENGRAQFVIDLRISDGD